MTKSFTAAAVLLLRDEGRLRLDDPVTTWVPELAATQAAQTADSPSITIGSLLTMSAGLPTDDPWGDRQQGLAFGPFFDLLREPLPTAWPPDTRFEYSNLGYGILGRVITNSSGIEYRDLVRTRFLEPLGMTATTYAMEEIPADQLAHGYVRRDDAWLEEPIDGYGALASMGGVFTSVADLARWVAGFTDAFPPRDAPDDGHPLRRATRREMQQARRSVDPELTWASTEAAPILLGGGYGYGLFIADDLRLGRVVGPRRRISRVRLEHDVAPGLRDRCRRGRQRPLRADVPTGHGGARGAGRRIAGACASCRSVAGHDRGAGRRGAPARALGRRRGGRAVLDERRPRRARRPSPRGDRGPPADPRDADARRIRGAGEPRAVPPGLVAAGRTRPCPGRDPDEPGAAAAGPGAHASPLSRSHRRSSRTSPVGWPRHSARPVPRGRPTFASRLPSITMRSLEPCGRQRHGSGRSCSATRSRPMARRGPRGG